MFPVKKIALIGAAERARKVVKPLLAAANGRIRVAAICDPDVETGRQTLEFLGATDACVCDSLDQMLAMDDIDWVLVCSYNHLHCEHSVAALRAGKNVFAEKPLATTLEDAVAIFRAIEASGRVFSFGLVLRYSYFYRKIKQLLVEGRIGELISMEFNETLDFNHGGHIFSNWRRFKAFSGGHMLEKCCHDLDIANWLIDSVALRCASFGGKRFFVPENAGRIEQIGTDAKGRPAYKTWPGRHPYDPFGADSTVVDHQVGIIEYHNGVKATFHTNANTAIPERRLYLCGSEGTLRADLVTGMIEVKRIGFDTVMEQIDCRADDGHGGGDAVMAQGLFQTICESAAPLATAQDGLEACLVAFGLTEAAESGGVVCIDSLRKRADTLLRADALLQAGADVLSQAGADAPGIAETD